jgi:hypothetical protein
VLFSSNLRFPKGACTENSKFADLVTKNARFRELKGERKVAIRNTFTGISSQCSLTANYAYIFYVSNISEKTTSSPGIISNSSVSTYFDYAKRAIKRTVSLTEFDVIILCTIHSFRACTEIRSLPTFAEQIKVILVDENIWLKPYEEFNVKQKRPKLMHAYGTTQVFNPEYVNNYTRLIFMDLDTFLMRNVDELFCTEGFAAAKRPSVPLFNGGVFAYSPSKHTYEAIMNYMIDYMKKPGEKKFAMQAILHEIFGSKFYCVHPVYNCGGFCGGTEKCSQISPKCGIADEAELFVKVAIVHSKIGEPHLRQTFPTLYKLWLSYG